MIITRKYYIEIASTNSTTTLFDRAYINGRKQQLKINNIFSNRWSTDYGIPQGNISGPTLFLLYINDYATIVNFNLENC